jgi:hypothetical protein
MRASAHLIFRLYLDSHPSFSPLPRKMANKCFCICHLKTKDEERRSTVIEIVTEKTSRLPMRDIAVYDIGDDGELFGLELGNVCFS